MVIYSSSEARDHLSDLINAAKYAKERVIITVRGKNAAVIIPLEDLEILEYIEDQIDMSEAAESRDEVKKTGAIPWEKVKENFNCGLKDHTPKETSHGQAPTTTHHA